MKTIVRMLAIVATIVQTLTTTPATLGCTGITIRPGDGSIIFGRTLEFAMDMQSNAIVVPRGMQYVGTAPGDKPGFRWKSKYGYVGVNAFDMPVSLDGLNEKGLAVGLFYFPGYAKYQKLTPADMNRAIAPWEVGAYLLSTSANVKEAVAAAKEVRVGDTVQKNMGMVPPAHFIVNDAQGNCVVLEFIDGQLKVHENPLGVMSNSPSFDWHLTNLSNYVNLTVNNVPQVDFGGNDFKSFGQGSGMLGLPGDFTPPSRFVRAVAFSKSAVPVKTAREGVLQVFHILNQFDIPKGAARGKEQGQVVSDYTEWTAASDLTNLRYYFRTFDNSQIRMIDLKTAEFGGAKVRTISMQGEEQIEDVTGQGK